MLDVICIILYSSPLAVNAKLKCEDYSDTVEQQKGCSMGVGTRISGTLYPNTTYVN